LIYIKCQKKDGMNTKPIKQLMAKNMDRKEFLVHVGVGAMAVIGITGLLKTLNAFSTHSKVDSGYGSSAYGGVSRTGKK